MRRFYLSVISGRRRGPGAFLFKVLLLSGSLVYQVLHSLRHLLYRTGLLNAVRLPVPVISVGNLTAGGTGKTPFVEMLARRLARKNLRVAILARGYGRGAGTGDDEELQPDLRAENVVRLTGADRVAAARRAIREFHADIVILDDGFQHFRIRRDLDILLVDATAPFANGHLIPLGLLRERPSAAARAHLVALTRCDQAAAGEVVTLRAQMERLAGGQPVIESAHRAVSLRTLSNRQRQPLEWLKGRRCYAFCGIGNPGSFRRTLEAAGAEVVKFRAFDDHHRYTPHDLQQIGVEAQEFMAEAFVTTEKDATRLPAESFDRPAAALRVELEITRGEALLDEAIKPLLPETTPVGALH